MASSGKRKTTMAKLNRESKLRQKRVEKAARKEERKLAAANPEAFADEPFGDGPFADEATADEATADAVPAEDRE